NLSQQISLPWSLELLTRYKDYWNWYYLSKNPSLPWTIELIERYRFLLNWSSLSTNPSLPWSIELIEKYEHKWDWSNLSKNPSLPWSVELIEKYNIDLKDLIEDDLEIILDMQLPSVAKQKYNHKWDWSYLSQNPPLPWSIELIEK